MELVDPKLTPNREYIWKVNLLITKGSLPGKGGKLELRQVAARVAQVETPGYAGGWLRQADLCGLAEVREAWWR